MADALLNHAVGSRGEVVLEVQNHTKVTAHEYGTRKGSSTEAYPYVSYNTGQGRTRFLWFLCTDRIMSSGGSAARSSSQSGFSWCRIAIAWTAVSSSVDHPSSDGGCSFVSLRQGVAAWKKQFAFTQ